MKNILYFLIFSFVSLITVACTSVTQSTDEAMVTPPASPDPGMTSVTGQVVSINSDLPIANTIIRLAQVVREGDEGAYVLDVAFSPGAMSDENGYFIFENITAQEYVIVVGDVYDQYKIIVDDEGKAKTWAALENQVLDVGLLLVDLNP
ncbi:MAG: hypothetical protein ACXADH_01210 [Candidatus Kariarchaeaceae archaeon]|jgi:hypothetical protein